jgi:hypothetical protein
MYATPAAHQYYSPNVQQNSPQHKSTGALNFRKVHHLMNVLKGDDLGFEERISIVEVF